MKVSHGHSERRTGSGRAGKAGAVMLGLPGSGGITLAADEDGPRDGHPVFLLHGGGQTRHAWGRTRKELGRRGYRAIAVDLRGHGQSDWVDDADYTPAAIAADIRKLVEWAGGRAALVGASLGGQAALIAAGETDPPICSALVLVDVTPRVDPQGAQRVIAFMRSHPAGFATVDEAADAVAAYLPQRPRPRNTAGLARNLRRGANGRYLWHWDPALVASRPENVLMPTGQLMAAASRIAVPTLLIRGALSDVVTEETASEFVALVRNAEFVRVSDAAHMVAGDQNDVFTSSVVDFLERAVRAERGARRDSSVSRTPSEAGA
jgi:pimeloyl-ACP methyl ester carboxylesterase